MKSSVFFLALALSGCGGSVANRSPLNEDFPSVLGQSLAGEEVRIPDDLEPGLNLLLIGYEQRAQFDCDRWILGLAQAGTPVSLKELPTIDGMLPGMFSGRIDSGMRSGIPEEDWPVVITVYGSGAEELVRFTGDERGSNARVVLLDEDGVVRWFHDRGYSASKLLELDRVVLGLSAANLGVGESQ